MLSFPTKGPDGGEPPFLGVVYTRGPDGQLQEVGEAQGQLAVPDDAELVLVAGQLGRSDQPFGRIDPDTFHALFVDPLAIFTDDDLVEVGDLTGLPELALGYVYSGPVYTHGPFHRITDAGMRSLAGLSRLKEFSLMSKQVTDVGLGYLTTAPLEQLTVSHAPLTGDGIRRLSTCNLRHLTLEFMDRIGANLSFLRQLPPLDSLGLRSGAVDDEQLAHLDAQPVLTWLDLGNHRADYYREPRYGARGQRGIRVSDAGMMHLRHLDRLDTLLLDKTEVGDEGLSWLTDLPLRRLSLDYTPITPDGLSIVAGMSRLEGLALSGTRTADEGIAELTALTNLKELRLGGARITNRAYGYLTWLRRLERLELWGTNVTPDDLATLAALPDLRYLDVGEVEWSEDDLAKVKARLPGVELEWHSALS